MAPRERLAHYENNIVSDVSAFPAGPDYEKGQKETLILSKMNVRMRLTTLRFIFLNISSFC